MQAKHGEPQNTGKQPSGGREMSPIHPSAWHVNTDQDTGQHPKIGHSSDCFNLIVSDLKLFSQENW